MAKKRKCSSASSTPKQSNQSKKTKVNTQDPDSNNNSTTRRKSTRSANNVEISNGDIQNVKVQTKSSAAARKRPSTIQNGSSKKAKKTANSKVKSEDESIDDQQLNDKQLSNGDTKKDDLDLSADEKSCSEEEQSLSKKSIKNKSIKKGSQIDNDSDTEDDQSSKVMNKKKRSKTQRKQESSGDEEKNVHSDDNSNHLVEPFSDDVRRSARKRKSRFSFRELVSSGSEDEEEEFASSSRKAVSSRSKRNNKPSKKEMKRKLKEFLGSDDEDEYNPNNSEQSDDDEIIDADEEVSDDDGNESDISDVLPSIKTQKSRFFKNKPSSNKSVSRNVNSTVSLDNASKSVKVDSDVSKYKASRSGGCLFNSIGIETLGNPQADLLKHKIANFKVPSDLTKTVSQACRSAAQPEQESVFGGGSCVQKFLASSHITKHYENYKNKFIEKSKTNDPKELMNILTEFETDLANSDQQPKSTDNIDSAPDTDDDDFEEVENADVGDDFDTYRPACLKAGVTIEVQPSFKPKAQPNKNDDWIYDAIRQGINRQRRDIFINATKVGFLCHLARVKYLNQLTFDPEMQALALSIDFFTGLKTESITLSFVEKFVDEFKKKFKFNYSKEKSQLLSSREAIRECFETKETHHPTVYNLALLILFRTFCSQQNSIEEKSRLCIAFRPIDSKCDDLISKKSITSGATKGGDELSEEDEEAPAKSKGKGKGKVVSKKKEATKSKGKSKKKDISEDEDDEDEEEEPKKSKKSAKKTVIKEKDETTLNKKNLIEIWIEIRVQDSKELAVKMHNSKKTEKKVISSDQWYCVEPINDILSTTPTDSLEKKFHANPLYILSFDSKNHLKDLTTKYIANCYLHKFKRLRLEDDYLEQVYSIYRPLEPTLDDQNEDEQIKRYHLDQPLPKSLSDYKSHGLYFLERHLLKYEIIWPEDAPVVGRFNNKERVYLRENVHQTHGKEHWKKEGRQVKEGEEPLKVVTGRPKWIKKLNEWDRDITVDLYHYSQTEDWDPGEVVDGKVPRNSYGNVDLFKPSMLPRGAAYLRLNGLLKIANRLNIDCVPAVTGFELKKRMTIPLVDGFICDEQYAEILTIAWKEEQEAQYQKDIDKYYKRVYGNWRKLIKGMIRRMEIKKKYGGDDEVN